MYAIDPRDLARIEKKFTYHRPGGDQPERYTTLRAYAREMAMKMLGLVPDSVERDIALLKLEESIFWANAAIARNENWAEPTPVAPLPDGVPTLAHGVEEAKPAPQVVKVEPFEALPVPGGTAAQEKFELSHGLTADGTGQVAEKQLRSADDAARASSPLSE